MRISSVSKLTDTPVSTIRAYEKWGLLTPTRRLDNGYREFESYHVTQVKIIRLVFGGFLNKRLRALSMKVLHASVAQDWDLCIMKTNEYMQGIQMERKRAMDAIDNIKIASVSKQLKYETNLAQSHQYTSEEAADIISTTKGSIRNWERNGLINCDVKRYERRRYDDIDLERMKIIDLMLQIGFSMACVKRFFVLFDEGKVEEAIHSIESTPKKEDLLTAADAWIQTLTIHEGHCKEILAILKNVNDK